MLVRFIPYFYLLSHCLSSTSNAFAFFYRPSYTVEKSHITRDCKSKRKPKTKSFKLFGKNLNDSNNASERQRNQDRSPSTFESMVRKITGIEDYKFGDLSRGTVATATNAFEESVKKTTGKEDYRFGDFSKGTVEATTHVVEDIVKKTTGKDYKFGDLTRGTLKAGSNALSFSEMTLSLVRDANINELVELSRYFWQSNMDDKQRKEVFVVVVNLGAITVLAYNLVANIHAGLINAAAWSMSSVKLGNSPLNAKGGWDVFLRTKQSLDILFGAPFLPARVALTIPIFFQYQRWIRTLQSVSPLKKFPILNRITSFVTMWLGVNITTYVIVSLGFAWVSSLFNGIPLK